MRLRRFGAGEGGFTLIEIMIVVGIMAILSAIAIPNFMVMQLRARRAEAPALLGGVVVAEHAYFQAFGDFLDGPIGPRADAALDTHAVPWPLCGGGGDCGWTYMGWAPQRAVSCNYEAKAEMINGAPGFHAWASCDLDNDDVLVRFYGSSVQVVDYEVPGDSRYF